jgi:phosphopantetheinyl transferase
VPVFFQQQINETTRLAIWKIEETEEFFLGNVPLEQDVTHPQKRLQHLAGRFLLQFLFPDFPFELVRIADTKKPFLEDEQYHFSISHCGDYAAAIVSRDKRVGIDIEIPGEKVLRVKDKFLNEEEKKNFLEDDSIQMPTLLWCAKEAVFKWYGLGGVDFRKHILLTKQNSADQTIHCFFSPGEKSLNIHYAFFDHLIMTWIMI